MTPEELKSVLGQEMACLQESLKHFAKSEDINREIEGIKKSVEANNIKGLEDQLGKLEKAAEEMGMELKRIKDQGPAQVKSFRDVLADKADMLSKMADSKDSQMIIPTTRKAVTAASVTSDTSAYLDSGVGQIQRGMEWVRDLFPVVTLGSNSHGTVKWYEQLAITNNASDVAEANSSASPSDLTWVEKTLSGKRLKDFIKISKDQLKDVDFVAGEVQGLINKNMRLLENSQLYGGTGLTNYVKGIKTYTTEFDTTGIAVPKANIFDLIQKVKTQIKLVGLDGFNPNTICMNPAEVDLLRLAKNADGDYLFPQWALGGMPTLAGMRLVENSLVTANTLLLGDFNYGTIFVWDGLMIEMGYVNTDFTDGYVTINAYERLNIRVKDADVNAFRKVSDVSSAIASITEAGA